MATQQNLEACKKKIRILREEITGYKAQLKELNPPDDVNAMKEDDVNYASYKHVLKKLDKAHAFLLKHKDLQLILTTAVENEKNRLPSIIIIKLIYKFLAPPKIKNVRKLPHPISANEWSQSTLNDFKIKIVIEPNIIDLFTVDENSKYLMRFGDKIPAGLSGMFFNLIYMYLSDKSQEILNDLKSVSRLTLDQSCLPNKGSSFVIKKYMSLIYRNNFNFESLVDDFVIQLLHSIGYNDGRLVVLARNKLELMMKGKEVKATADITVVDYESGIRLVVTEVCKFYCLFHLLFSTKMKKI